MIVLSLPFPISANALTGKGRGRVFRSKEYNAWIKEADGCFLQQKRGLTPIKGHYTLVLTLDATRRKGDADNFIKGVSDALQRFGLIENDKLCDRVTVQWGDVEGCSVVILPAQKREAA